MSKFRVKLKIQGFDLEIEGTREDVPFITKRVGQQVAGMLQPVSDIIEAEVTEPRTPVQTAVDAVPTRPRRRRAQHKPKEPSQEGGSGESTRAVDWTHDPSKWGTPQQGWPTAKKAMWLLFVVHNELNIQGLTAEVIETTFNKHFRQAKPIRRSNIRRDLGQLKTKTNAGVYEDTTKSPPVWFLTQEGLKAAANYVAEGKGQQPGA